MIQDQNSNVYQISIENIMKPAKMSNLNFFHLYVAYKNFVIYLWKTIS